MKNDRQMLANDLRRIAGNLEKVMPSDSFGLHSTVVLVNQCAELRELARLLDMASEGPCGGTLDVAQNKLALSAPFCVIGRSVVTDRAINRTWKQSREDAEYHASNLLSKHGQTVEDLLVVRAVSIVRKKRNHEVVEVM